MGPKLHGTISPGPYDSDLARRRGFPVSVGALLGITKLRALLTRITPVGRPSSLSHRTVRRCDTIGPSALLVCGGKVRCCDTIGPLALLVYERKVRCCDTIDASAKLTCERTLRCCDTIVPLVLLVCGRKVRSCDTIKASAQLTCERRVRCCDTIPNPLFHYSELEAVEQSELLSSDR